MRGDVTAKNRNIRYFCFSKDLNLKIGTCCYESV